jgi:hypothetical protein
MRMVNDSALCNKLLTLQIKLLHAQHLTIYLGCLSEKLLVAECSVCGLEGK